MARFELFFMVLAIASFFLVAVLLISRALYTWAGIYGFILGWDVIFAAAIAVLFVMYVRVLREIRQQRARFNSMTVAMDELRSLGVQPRAPSTEHAEFVDALESHPETSPEIRSHACFA